MSGIIELWESVGLGLIIEYPSGIIYSNQTGGTSTLHPELEGVFVPLRNDVEVKEPKLVGPQNDLLRYFEGPNIKAPVRLPDLIRRMQNSSKPFWRGTPSVIS